MDRIYLDLPQERWYPGMVELFHRLLGLKAQDILPLKEERRLKPGQVLIRIQQGTHGKRIWTRTQLQDDKGKEYQFRKEDREILHPLYEEGDYGRRFLARAREGIYRVLSSYGRRDLSPWGVLLGVRPTKLLHSLFDRGFDVKKAQELLEDLYCVHPDKVKLLLKVVGAVYTPLSSPSYRKGISIYIGIPFCPSRCHYCSFPSEPVKKGYKNLISFLLALKEEIKVVGHFIRTYQLPIYSIYMGGGTPSVLPFQYLKDLLLYLREVGIKDPFFDFTLEAGRPETLTEEKLQVMRSLGVNRISINPQTIHDKTLLLMGRRHTYKDIKEAYQLSRSLGFHNINMDLIMGLPGEGFLEMKESLQEILSLNPDHVTVHVLAKKRGAALEFDHHKALAMEGIFALRDSLFGEMGLRPYYLYRQKDMASDQENVGYAHPGKESYFNLAMMEERQTVIGLGGNAVSKLINPRDLSMIRLKNPKYPTDYCNLLEQLLAVKGDRLTKFLPWVKI